MPYSLDQLMGWGVDGFEIINGGSYKKYDQIRQFCINNSLICIAGSDIHTNEDLNTFTKLKLDDPSNKTLENIFNNLKNNTHETIAIQFYPKIVNFPGELTDLGLYVLEDLINLNIIRVFIFAIIVAIIVLIVVPFILSKHLRKHFFYFVR